MARSSDRTRTGGTVEPAAARATAAASAAPSAPPTALGTPPAGEDRLFVGSIAKCFQLLEAMNRAGRPLSLTELAELAELDRSAAQRITHTLRKLGYLRQHPENRTWTLATRLLEFGHTVLAIDRLRQCAYPHLDALNQRCGETVNLMELEGAEIVYVARFPSRHAVSVDLHVGSRLPAFCTAAGRAILAGMKEAEASAILASAPRQAMTERTVTELPELLRRLRQAACDGYAINDQEAFIGDLSVAAPIVDRHGRPLGAINIAVPTPRWSLARVRRELIPPLLQTATAISAEFVTETRHGL